MQTLSVHNKIFLSLLDNNKSDNHTLDNKKRKYIDNNKDEIEQTILKLLY